MTEEEFSNPLVISSGIVANVPLSNVPKVNVPFPEMKKSIEVVSFSLHDPPQDLMGIHEETNSSHSTSSIHEYVDPLIQDLEQCCTILQLFLEHIEVVSLLPHDFQERLVHSFQATSLSPDGANTPRLSKISIESVQPLSLRLPIDHSITSDAFSV
jgi:hypothetical protein